MKRMGMLALAALLLPLVAGAQQAPAPTANPITSVVKQQEARSAKNQVAAAQLMPADKYGFIPMPGMMTFGQQILHISQMNNMACAWISGMTAPDIKDVKDTDPKDKLVGTLKASFDFCTSALSGVDDSNLGQIVGKMGPNTMSRGAALLFISDEWSDHYGAQATYLRLNGILPPTAQPQQK